MSIWPITFIYVIFLILQKHRISLELDILPMGITTRIILKSTLIVIFNLFLYFSKLLYCIFPLFLLLFVFYKTGNSYNGKFTTVN